MTTNPYTNPAWADQPTMDEIKRQMAIQDARKSKPGFWWYIEGIRWTTICTCGHPIPKHGKPGEYAYCMMPRRCECGGEEGSRVAFYTRGDLRAFNRQARGNEQPHALNGAIEKTAPEDIMWEVRQCDFCDKVETPLKAVALDEQNRPMIRKPKDSMRPLDTGHHRLLCATCFEEAALTPVENTMETLGMDPDFIAEVERLAWEKNHGRV